ncbi:DUF3037 domain-containing protein [Variovorax sp. PMC12]|uniref:DUF3037 domain-containing protein n=1 Tax=Variovorax sp. PMC12 TaxID=2126319 RepID=UPI000D12323E|nr:DUF3037 domain-containing protein [Variovorax sp. PMC12]AVQ84308.1 hypothetical protein C4F17_27045 [Variovorax sp. PMC12]
MTEVYHYVVLRLAPDFLRGEALNVGIVLFPMDKRKVPSVIMMAALNKLRAVDATWDAERLRKWAKNIETILRTEINPQQAVNSLGSFGFCDPKAIGMFTADSATEVTQKVAEIKITYVSNKTSTDRQKREKKTRLQTALRDQFKKMQVLGDAVDDIAEHLVVANVPVPDYPELKTDFLYKNGVYRVTQTIDYRVAPDSLHNKLSEACVKSTAAELALKSYGDDTLRLAVLDIPDEFRDAADNHVDLLLSQGFEVFDFNDQQQMLRFYELGAPPPKGLALDLPPHT